MIWGIEKEVFKKSKMVLRENGLPYADEEDITIDSDEDSSPLPPTIPMLSPSILVIPDDSKTE